ncbi:unnamed protein product [Dibothriocephalus latus]|uniref:Secreted protein n=1 Tax=Dibothriocephalus latus TaxID=60516 RepID=A0A3P7NLE0_DIBLA|nr:unnamed protein product [Dibothriocephalus latus]
MHPLSLLPGILVILPLTSVLLLSLPPKLLVIGPLTSMHQLTRSLDVGTYKTLHSTIYCDYNSPKYFLCPTIDKFRCLYLCNKPINNVANTVESV